MNISKGFKKYFFNTSWLLFERVFIQVIVILVGIIVTRYQGPMRFGLLSYATSYIGLFMAIASLGLDSIVVQMIVREPENTNTIIGTSFLLKLLGSIITIITIGLTLVFSNEDTQSKVLIAVVSLSYVFQALSVIEFHFTAKVTSKYYVYARSTQTVVSSCIRIVFVLFRASLIWFAWLVVFDALFLGFTGILIYHRTGYSIWRWKFSTFYAKNLLKQSWPLILSTIAVGIYMKIDQVMIKSMMDASAVGFYAAAVRISEGWYFVPAIITASLFPAIVKVKTSGKRLYNESLLALYSVLTWLFIFLCIPIAFFSNQLVILLLGKSFAPAGPVLQIHIWNAYFVFLGVASGRWLLVESLQIIDLLRAVLGAIVNVCLNLFLIPNYGIQGAAVATLIAQFTSSFLVFAFFAKGRDNLWRMIRAIIPQRTIIRQLVATMGQKDL